MPNPTRLYRLTHLREAAGLTLAAMAARCDVTGKQGRKTAGDWEAGRATPRTSQRTKFVSYLWNDLKLCEEPALFDEVWQLLVEEWAWEPLSAAERVQLLVTPTAPPLTTANTVTETENLPTDVLPAEMPTTTPDPLVAPLRLDPVLSPPFSTPAPSRFNQSVMLLTRHRWLLIIVPLLLLLVGRQVWWGMADEALPPPSATVVTPAAAPPSLLLASDVLITSTVAVAARPSILINGGFDQLPNFTGWNLDEACDYQIVADESMAQDGDRYLAIRNRRPNCYSFYQNVLIPLEVGTTYRAAIWLRSATGNARRGRLALWALGGEGEHHERGFAVGNMAWTCLETTLSVQRPDHAVLKFEVYLDSPDGLDYHFDSAVLMQGSEPALCPAPQLAIADLQLVQPSGQIYPGATVGVAALVKNVGSTDLPQETFIRYWVAEQENDGPLDPGTIRGVTIPPLAAGETTVVAHLDLYLPINLPAEPTCFLVADVALTDQPTDFSLGFDRVSHPFMITPCSQGTLYCDVPADHWAAAEIQAWFDAGISQICRSNTEPFRNRPFCPDGVVQRWMMVFFLLRRLEGADYQPTNVYQGLFEDVPAEFEHNGARWIEALTTERVDLRSDACPPRGEYLRFCPRDPLRRVDFVRALLELQRWELADVKGTRFVDMPAGTNEARAAEYMWQQGYLPENDIDCPANTGYRRFCPTAPLRRASAAVMMSRALGLVAPANDKIRQKTNQFFCTRILCYNPVSDQGTVLTGTTIYMSQTKLLERIIVNPLIFGGKPVIRGRRLAVEHVLGMLAAGDTTESLLEAYPWLDDEDIQACLLYAQRIISNEHVEPLIIGDPA